MQEVQTEQELKKQNSYHYWHSSIPKSSVPINTAPQKIQAPVIDSDSSQPSQPRIAPSSWNVSGTWEERKISLTDLDGRLSTALVGTKTLKDQAQISTVSSQGEIALIFTRGKKSLTYDLQISLEYKGLGAYQDCFASLKFVQFNDVGDREYSVVCDTGAKKDPVKQAIKEQIGRIVKTLQGELTKFKQN